MTNLIPTNNNALVVYSPHRPLPVTNNNLIPTDPEFPGQFLESLEKSNAGHSDQAPVAVILLSSVNNASQMCPANFHFIEQVARTHRIYLRLINHPSQIQSFVKEASTLTRKLVDRLILNGHTQKSFKLRLGTKHLMANNLTFLSDCFTSLTPTACITLKGCLTANMILSSEWHTHLIRFLDKKQIEGNRNLCPSARTFFVDNQVYTYDEEGKPIINRYKVNEEWKLLIPLLDKEVPLFENVMHDKIKYLEKYQIHEDYYPDIRTVYANFAQFLEKKGKNEEALEITNKMDLDYLKFILKRWENLDSSIKSTWINMAAKIKCQGLIDDFLKICERNNDLFFAAQFFIQCCQFDQISNLEVLVKHPLFLKMDCVISVPSLKGKLKNWFSDAWKAAAEKPDMLSILRETRWAKQLH